MNGIYNIYCDESCHLQNDHQPIMVLGAVWCPTRKTREVAERLREIKIEHGLPAHFESKWNKVSVGQQKYYSAVLNYFLDDDDLNFRGLIADKVGLAHDGFGQSHDDWYYKMYFYLLNPLLDPEARYRIFVDYKDTRGGPKIQSLHDVLCNNMWDFERRILQGVHQVQSHQVEQIQLADLLCGIIAYANRGLTSNVAKTALVERLRKRSGYQLTRSTLLRARKVNLFHWSPLASGNWGAENQGREPLG